MIALRGVYIYRWILLVVSLQIQLLLLVQVSGVDVAVTPEERLLSIVRVSTLI